MPRSRVSNAGVNDAETARVINALPWEPPPGMVKLRCESCRYWFAAPGPNTPLCPDCAILAEIARRERQNESLAEAVGSVTA